MKCKKHLFVIVVLLLILKPLIPHPEKFERLDKVKNSITLLKVESDISFDAAFYQGLRAEDFDEEIDILTLHQLRRLARFAEKNLPEIFEAPMIVMQIKADFVKEHKMIVVRNLYPSRRHTKELVFVINKDARNIYRLGRYETEGSEMICNLAKTEIDIFNKFIKKEKLRITDPQVALGVFQLFLTLVRQREVNIIGDRDDFTKKIGVILQDGKGISEIKGRIDSPAFCRIRDDFRMKLFTSEISGNTLLVGYWDVNINKNGTFKPNANEYFRWP